MQILSDLTKTLSLILKSGVESNVYRRTQSIAFACWRCESGVVGVVHQGQLCSLGLVWRQRLIWDVQRGSDDSLYWRRRVRDLL